MNCKLYWNCKMLMVGEFGSIPKFWFKGFFFIFLIGSIQRNVNNALDFNLGNILEALDHTRDH